MTPDCLVAALLRWWLWRRLCDPVRLLASSSNSRSCDRLTSSAAACGTIAYFSSSSLSGFDRVRFSMSALTSLTLARLESVPLELIACWVLLGLVVCRELIELRLRGSEAALLQFASPSSTWTFYRSFVHMPLSLHNETKWFQLLLCKMHPTSLLRSSTVSSEHWSKIALTLTLTEFWFIWSWTKSYIEKLN